MKRVISLYLPSWSIDRLRRKLGVGVSAPPPNAPLILAGRDGRRRVVYAANEPARQQGARCGMAATQAQALVPGLTVHEAVPAEDNAALEQLGLWAIKRYAPIVAADPPDGLMIDVTGASHLWGGEDALLCELVERLACAGIEAHAAIADTYGAAHACARHLAYREASDFPTGMMRSRERQDSANTHHPSDLRVGTMRGRASGVSTQDTPSGEPHLHPAAGYQTAVDVPDRRSLDGPDRFAAGFSTRYTRARGGRDLGPRGIFRTGINARARVVISSAETAAAIAPLPVSALRLPDLIVDGLRRLGFETIGDLEAQPRAPLALRFGPELGRRLDQARGRLAEPLAPLAAPELVSAARGFAEPIGAPETIARHIGLLVTDLCATLELLGLGVRKLDLIFHRVDNSVAAIRAGTAKPVREVKRLTRLLTDRLETVDPGFGIERMSLTAVIAEPLIFKASSSSLTDGPEPDVSDLVDILANRVGADRLYRLAAVQSDVPERSVRRVAPLADPTPDRWPKGWPRPTRLLKRPERVEAMALLPDQPPVAFTWRGMRRRVKRADGPERIYGEWRKRDAELTAVRDYFQVEDETGARFWLFRTGDGEDPATGAHGWFLHGIFG